MPKKFGELPMMEQLAIKQALYNSLGEDVSTKNPDSIRSYTDYEIISNYRTMVTKPKSYDVVVNNHKVGTYSVRTSKPKPARTEKRLVIKRPQAFELFVAKDAYKEAVEYAQLCAQNFAEFLLNTYGIVADGVEVVDETIPEQPSQILGTTLKVDKEKVAEAIYDYLPTSIAGLFEDEASEY